MYTKFKKIILQPSCRNLADVDKDGKLKAEEFILAMHLVDVAKSGQPLPLTLPTELVPPSQRYVDTHELLDQNLSSILAIEMLDISCCYASDVICFVFKEIIKNLDYRTTMNGLSAFLVEDLEIEPPQKLKTNSQYY